MKQLLSIFIAVLVAITAFGQSNPPNKLRSNDSFTQVDNYLVAAKRLGIPTGDTPTLNASTTTQNSAKLFYNTSDESLYVYDAVSETWNQVSADIDLSNYYTIAQVDSAIEASSPFNLIDVTQQSYTDKAINVIAFDNQNSGVTYKEGAIDFGVNRDSLDQMGLYSMRTGLENTASGDYSIAFGRGTKSTSFYSTSFGLRTQASGSGSVAFGNGTKATGLYSAAFGTNTTAANYSVAFGNSSIASGGTSAAFGNSTASGVGSASFGNSTASGTRTFSAGTSSQASGVNSAAFGVGSIANEFAALAIGQYSTDGAVETSRVTGSPIFKVGNGTGPTNRSNAYVLYNDGRSEQVKDIEVTEIGQGVVIKSPDGTRWRITVDNSGNLITTAL